MNAMSKTSRLLAPLFLSTALLAGTAAADDKPKITEVFKAPLANVEGMEAIVSHVDYPPGFDSPRHYHTGSVVVYVLEGVGSMEVDGVSRTGSAGEVIQEHAEKIMVMSNESDSDWLRFVVFQVGPEGEPMIVLTD